MLAICTTALNVFRLLVLYLKPVLPGLAERAEAFLDIPPLTWADAGTLLLDHPINKFKPLLSRVDMAHIEAMLADSRDTNPAASTGKRRPRTPPRKKTTPSPSTTSSRSNCAPPASSRRRRWKAPTSCCS